MTHDHNHGHNNGHSHDHNHNHNHSHDHSHGDEMSMEDKLLTLFSHWIDHNDSHKDNFVSWAAKARKEGFEEVALALEQAGELSQGVTGKLEEALAKLKG